MGRNSIKGIWESGKVGNIREYGNMKRKGIWEEREMRKKGMWEYLVGMYLEERKMGRKFGESYMPNMGRKENGEKGDMGKKGIWE